MSQRDELSNTTKVSCLDSKESIVTSKNGSQGHQTSTKDPKKKIHPNHTIAKQVKEDQLISNEKPEHRTSSDKPFNFPWKIFLCGLGRNNLERNPPGGSMKRWNFRQIILKKNLNVLKVLQNSRKTDETLAQEILSPVPQPAVVECIPNINDNDVENKTKGLSGDERHQEEGTKRLLDPIQNRDRGKKCLIIDLDETLVHSSFKFVDNADFQVSVDIEGVSHQVYVLKRPYVEEFLAAIGHLYECVLFTASLSKYADPVADFIDKNKIFRHRLFREACVYHVGSYVKDLSLLGRPLDQIIILDNSPASFLFHPNNAIQISSWFDDKSDTALRDLIPYFESLARVPNVPNYLNSNDPISTAAAIGSKGLSSHPNFQTVSQVGQHKNCHHSVISQVVSQHQQPETRNPEVPGASSSNMSQKQHDNYSNIRSKKGVNRNSSIPNSAHSNYPVVTRKQISSHPQADGVVTNSGESARLPFTKYASKDASIPKTSFTQRPLATKNNPKVQSSSVMATSANHNDPESYRTSNHSREKIQSPSPNNSNNNRGRLIISESNQLRKDKFLKR